MSAHRDPLRRWPVVLVVLVAPFLVIFAVRALLSVVLAALGVTEAHDGGDLPRIAGFFVAFAVGTTVCVPAVRRWSKAPAVTALVVASWYAGAAWVGFADAGRFERLLPVAVLTGVGVFWAVWSGLRQLGAHPRPRGDGR